MIRTEGTEIQFFNEITNLAQIKDILYRLRQNYSFSYEIL